MFPKHTRLRWVSAKDPGTLEKFCESLGRRIQIYQIVWDGSSWVMWFVPDDKGADVTSGKYIYKGVKK